MVTAVKPDRRRLTDWATGTGLFLLALLPRLITSPGIFVNVDEATFWIVRTKHFLLALTGHGLGNMVQAGHPGVTLMWLMAGPEALMRHWPIFNWWHDPIVGYLTVLVFPLLVLTSAFVVIVWRLLRRIVRPNLALGIAALFAVDPLYLVFSRYLHLDALVTGLLFIGFLALWIAGRDGQRRYAILAGCCFALAGLTRLNALIGVVFAILAWAGTTRLPVRQLWRLFALFAASFALTVIVVWPATVGAPRDVARSLAYGLDIGLTTHEVPRNVDTNPIVRNLLYPVFLGTRSFPIVLVLAIAGLFFIRGHKNRKERKFLFAILLFCLTYLIVMTLAPKKLDRYALPAVIGLDVFAAFGAAALWEKLRSRWRMWLAVAGVAAMAVQLGIFWRLTPYYQTYANALTWLAERTPLRTSAALHPAWGEGLYEASHYLRDRYQPFPRVASWFATAVCYYGRPIGPHDFPFGPQLDLECPDGLNILAQASNADYLLLSRDQVSQRIYPGLLDDIARLHWQPETIIQLNRQPYIWIYRNRGGLRPNYSLGDAQTGGVLY